MVGPYNNYFANKEAEVHIGLWHLPGITQLISSGARIQSQGSSTAESPGLSTGSV